MLKKHKFKKKTKEKGGKSPSFHLCSEMKEIWHMLKFDTFPVEAKRKQPF